MAGDTGGGWSIATPAEGAAYRSARGAFDGIGPRIDTCPAAGVKNSENRVEEDVVEAWAEAGGGGQPEHQVLADGVVGDALAEHADDGDGDEQLHQQEQPAGAE